MRQTQLSLLAALTALILSAANAFALEPNEIAILAVKSSPQSRELAEYYAGVRGVPPKQICLLDVKPGEAISRAE
jgi:hypothetical protein